MKHLRSILASIALIVFIYGCTDKCRAQTAAPAAVSAPATVVPPAPGHPALWVVHGPHATVYLFGSVHLLPRTQDWRTPQFNNAVASSHALWLEVTGAEDPKLAQPLIMQLGIDQAHPLSTKLSKEQLARLDTEAKTFNMSEAMLEPMRPWLASLTLSVAPLLKSGADPRTGVESILTAEFNNDKRPVNGFETLSQQFHFFSDLPPQTELDYLNLTIDDFDKSSTQFKQLTDLWAKGDQDGLDHLMDDEWRQKHPDIYQLIVAKRNLYFTRRIEDLIDGDGTSFVAVGAGHYVGPDGIIALLRNAGYTVERL